MPKLPGQDIDPNLELPQLPGVGVLPPTPAEQADSDATIARWNEMAKLRPALAALFKVLEAHPELVDWANASQAGTIRFSQPE